MFLRMGYHTLRVPQGTKFGPWLILVMINDLTVSDPFNIWKYVDDSTVSETILKGEKSNSQLVLNEVNNWTKKNLFQLNSDETKELVINFNRPNEESMSPLYIEDQPIKSVKSAKLLGVTLNSELSWNNHIENLVKSASRKLYFLVQLKRASVAQADIVQYYLACIRSSMDYACPVFHHSLPKYLREELEVSKREG